MIWRTGRLLWYEGDSNSASLNVALNAAILFDRYAPYSNVSWKVQQYHVRVPQDGLYI
jgi:endoglucanase